MISFARATDLWLTFSITAAVPIGTPSECWFAPSFKFASRAATMARWGWVRCRRWQLRAQHVGERLIAVVLLKPRLNSRDLAGQITTPAIEDLAFQPYNGFP